MSDTWRMKMTQRAMSIDNISFLSPPISKPLQYDCEKEEDEFETKDVVERVEITHFNDEEQTKHDMNQNGDENIIPWKKLLRKAKA
jgi:hypothetical protein